MQSRTLISILLFSLANFGISAQELSKVTPSKATASSFHKDPSLRVSSQNRQYASFYRDNSPEMVLDGEIKSTWLPVGKTQGEWIELEFPYPIKVSHIKVLSGCHITDRCFSGNKKVKKFEVTNEHGEKEKLTIKDPKDFTGYKLGFKKTTKTLRFKILSVMDESSRNAKSTIGFSEISVGHQVYNSEDLKLALDSQDLSKLKKAIKSAKKVIRSPYAIQAGGENPLERVTREGNIAMANLLWESGFRFYDVQNPLLLKVSTKAQLDAHFVQKAELNTAVEALESKLKDESQEMSWQELDDIRESLDGEFSQARNEQKESIAVLADRRRPYTAEKLLETQIRLLANERDPSVATLDALRIHQTENYELYGFLGDVASSKIESLRRSTLRGVLKKLTALERTKIEEFPREVTELPKLVALKKRFNSKYSQYSKYSEYEQVNDLFKAKKTSIVVENAEFIKKFVTSKNTQKELDQIRSIFLTNVTVTAPIAELRNFVRDRKKMLTSQAAALEKERKREEYERLKAEREAIFQKAMANSKKTILNIEWQLVAHGVETDRKNLTVYYSAEEMNVYQLLRSYMDNLDHNAVYLHNQLRNRSTEILISKEDGRMNVFSTHQELDSYFNTNTGMISFNNKPEITRVVNSAAWRLAQRCQSVKRHMDTVYEHKFRVTGVTLHKSTGLPVVWHTAMTEEICGQRASYDNCSLPCAKRLKVGSDNYYFIVSDYMKRWNTN